MINHFLNAWWIGVTIFHNKQMEALNNPTPEVVMSAIFYKERLIRLKKWASSRWGSENVAKRIYEREFQ